MERISMPPEISVGMVNLLTSIMDEADGQPVILDADVTTAGGELTPGQLGFNPTTRKLFKNIEGTVYYITLTAT